jgi:hypothetical protein
MSSGSTQISLERGAMLESFSVKKPLPQPTSTMVSGLPFSLSHLRSIRRWSSSYSKLLEMSMNSGGWMLCQCRGSYLGGSSSPLRKTSIPKGL